MARARPLEVKALVALLTKDWDSPEDLAEVLIHELDSVRAERTSYVGLLQIGKNAKRLLMGVGPFPGAKSAGRAVMRHPALSDESLVSGWAVVPIVSQEGYERRLKELDEPADSVGEYHKALAEVRRDAEAIKRGWKGNRKDRDRFLREE